MFRLLFSSDDLPIFELQHSIELHSTAPGWEYGLAGNQTRAQNESGVWLRFEHDEAGRKVKVKDDNGNTLETWVYSPRRERLIVETTASRKYFAWDGSNPLVEYIETMANPSSPEYSKSHLYAGSRLFSTSTRTSASNETTEFHHQDRLGTKLVTEPVSGAYYEQSTLPFGITLRAESGNFSARPFTSYERSEFTNLDYATNRIYSSGQSRFTQVDPLGMRSASNLNPQSLNLFAYVLNRSTDLIDPSGLYWAINWASCVYLGSFIINFDTPRQQTIDIYQCELSWINDTPIIPASGGGGSPAPLNEEENRRLDRRLEKIKRQLRKQKCREWLASRGVSLADLEAQLNDQSKRFSGPRSTEYTVEEAGLLGANARQEIEALPPGQAREAGLAVLGWSVSKWFENAYGGRVSAAVGSGGRVFYKNFNSVTTIIHENLHVSTGLNDIQLADKLGLQHNGTTESASQAISAGLQANGCT